MSFTEDNSRERLSVALGIVSSVSTHFFDGEALGKHDPWAYSADLMRDPHITKDLMCAPNEVIEVLVSSIVAIDTMLLSEIGRAVGTDALGALAMLRSEIGDQLPEAQTISLSILDVSLRATAHNAGSVMFELPKMESLEEVAVLLVGLASIGVSTLGGLSQANGVPVFDMLADVSRQLIRS